MTHQRTSAAIVNVTRLGSAIAILLLAAHGAMAETDSASDGGTEWPQFRGPHGLSTAHGSECPVEWGTEKNVAWKVAIAGTGWSSPIVWGDRVFISTAVTDDQSRPDSAGRGGPPGGFARGDGPGNEDEDGRPTRRNGRPNGPPPDGRGPGGPPPDGFGPGGPPPDGRGPGGPPPNGRGPRRGDRGPGDGRFDQADNGRPGDDGPGGRGNGGPGGGRPPYRGGRGGRGPEAPNSTYRFELICLNAFTGEELWKKVAADQRPAYSTHRTNTYASETPVTDGEHIYVYFGMVGVFCFDFEGNIVWQKELGAYPMMNGWGTGSSPILVGDHLIIQCDNERESFIVALDKRNGEEAWRKEREEKSTWSTPFVWHHEGRSDLIAEGDKEVIAYNPDDGSTIWTFDGLASRCSSSPIANNDLLIMGGGGARGSGPLYAIETTRGNGPDVTAKVAWKRPNAGPPMASPVIADGYVYVLEQRTGLISCYDIKTGKPAYSKKRLPASGFTSTPWVSGDKVYCLDQDGNTFVLQAGPEFKIIATNNLDEMCWASPALAHDSLYLRTVDHLYCFKEE